MHIRSHLLLDVPNIRQETRFGHCERARRSLVHLHTRVRTLDGFTSRLNTDTLTCRYAETQIASNGLRYRDWVCTFASDKALEKCKLEGHILDITHVHQALIPWKRDHLDTIEWVAARSSLPLEQRVLHDRIQPSAGVPRFTAFVRACKARLLQDIKLLPLREGQTSVDRNNVTVYASEAQNQILVVYAPNNSEQLEFVSFALLDKKP